MSVLMDLIAGSSVPEALYSIIPTIVLPFALVGVILSAVATFLAGLFGIELKSDGPRKLLDVLLSPRFLVPALFLNLAIWGGYKAFMYWYHHPTPVFYLQWKNEIQASQLDYTPVESLISFSEPSLIKKVSVIQPLWTTALDKGVFSSVALTKDAMFVGSDDGYAYELSKETGQVRRRFYIGTAVSPSPVIWQNHLYVGEGVHDTHHARIYKFDLKTGALSGTFTSLGHIEAAVKIHAHNGQTLMIISAGKGGVYGVDPVSMNQVWHQPIGHTDALVEAEEGVVFVGKGAEKGEEANHNRVFALRFETGEVLWSRAVPSSNWVRPLLTEQQVCFLLGDVYFNRDYGQLSCFDKASGEDHMTHNFEEGLIGNPIRIGDGIFFTGLLGALCRVDLKTQKKSWCQKHEVKSLSYSSVAYDGFGNLYYPSVKEGLLAYSLKGERVQHWKPEGDLWQTVAGTPVIENGFIYFADLKGQVRKLRLSYE